MSVVDTTNLEQDLAALVAEVIERDEAEILEKRSANYFSDLGLDSLLALEILVSIEKKYKISIPEERLVDITSFDATLDLVKQVIAEQEKS